MAFTAVKVSGNSLPKECIGSEREKGGTDSSVGVTRDCLQHMNSIIVYILPAEKVIVPILY